MSRNETTDEPAGWRTGPAWQEMNRTSRRRRRAKAVTAVVLVAGLAVVAVRPELVTDHFPKRETHAAAPLPAETARPSTAPPEELFPDQPTLKEPFRGSPALRWADGAAGIQLPEAKAVGGMSEKQVAHALAATKELLVASNIDPATLRGEYPKAALELLDPLQKDGRGLMEKALRTPSEEANPVLLFSRFDPSEARVVRDLVKTRGRITYEKGRSGGELLVHADFTFVYPVVKTKTGSHEEVDRTIVRRELTFALYDPQEYGGTPGKLYMIEWAQSTGNDDCTRAADGYFHPVFASDLMGGTPPGVDPSVEAVDPYDRSKGLDDLPQECTETTRT
ncbi:hypothetical protein [Streptomyces sp. TRM64462]|uniref:hypothetical protein n=1 Tax=Streptomyces sp. TRM64462 TaxID=2741726 RepID=UPI001586718A|nr:hypothetical protein [Streptomyces sp. TRM64462]